MYLTANCPSLLEIKQCLCLHIFNVLYKVLLKITRKSIEAYNDGSLKGTGLRMSYVLRPISKCILEKS